jgi:cytochrome c biogenesis protein CcmG/thiol:disulfide interchange protein DsbE
MLVKTIVKFNIVLAILLTTLPALYAADRPAQDFAIPSGNKTIKLSDYKGKVVYLDFWASWCIPCRKSFPWMNNMHQRYEKDGLVILAVNLDKNKADVKRFLAKYPAKFTVAYDPQGQVAELYQLQGMPSSYLIDKQGNLVQSHIGFRSDDTKQLEDHIRKLLN